MSVPWPPGPPAIVDKVVCYVVADQHLLAFAHDDVDILVTGVQVPAGTMRAGESAEKAALRELLEETGLHGRVVRILGEEEYDLRPARNEIAHRRFVLMEVDHADVEAQWIAGEADAETRTGTVSWTCRWIPLAQGHVLAAGLGALLARVPVQSA